MNASGNVLDGLVRSITSVDDSLQRLMSTMDDLSVTVGLWMPEEPELPAPGRFNNLEWEEQQ